MTVVVPVPVHLVQGAKTAVAWKVGGCSLDLQVVGEVATLTLPAPTCTLTVDDVPLASQLHLVTLGHLLIPSVAHFEVTRTAKPNQANYTFNPDEDGLSMNLEFTIRAQVDSPSFSTFTVSPTKVFGHRLP